MPRPTKGDITKMGAEDIEKENLRFEQIERLEAGIARLTPGRMTPTTIGELMASPRGGARAGLSLTLSTGSVNLLDRISRETGISRGRVIDWLLMKLEDYYNSEDEKFAKREKELFG